MKNKITLFLMTEKGFITLDYLLKQKCAASIEKVIIGKDRAVLNDYSNEIQALCDHHSIAYTFDRKSEFQSPYALAISWRWIIPSFDQKTIIVLHESLLPKYRGFAPLVNQLINGEKTVGVSALVAAKDYDTGPIVKQQKIPIDYPIKIQKAIEKVAEVYGEIAHSILSNYIVADKKLPLKKQEEKDATYSIWRDESDYKINWSKDSATIIKRKIDALGFPYQGASTYFEQKKIRILDAEEVKDVHFELRHAGKIFQLQNGKPIVICSTGLLKINEAVDDKKKESILPFSKLRAHFS